jgi:cytochrome c oxidase cbb3-type subunit III
MKLAGSILGGILIAAIAAGVTSWILASRAAYSHLKGTEYNTAGASLPLGDVVGRSAATISAETANPESSDPSAVAEGHKLFISMNCAGCHGYDAKGGMGPNLTDTYWRYGGTPAQIYQSIASGRPKGMPSWGKKLPARSIWQLTAYLQSLGGSFPAKGYQAAMQGDLGDKGQNKGASDQQ